MNSQHQSPPPGSEWGGPWMEVKFTSCNTCSPLPRQSMHANKVGYPLSSAELKISTALCGHRPSMLNYLPRNHGAEDKVKIKSDRIKSGAVRAIMSAMPNLQIDDTVGTTNSEE
jgi:hypothetical protein